VKTWVTTEAIGELVNVKAPTVLGWLKRGLMPHPARQGSPHVWHVSMVRKLFPRPLHGVGARKVTEHLKQLKQKKQLRDATAKNMRRFWTDHTLMIRKRIINLEERITKLEKVLRYSSK
jgi:hypothetical protein